jgi:hypothetical protein
MRRGPASAASPDFPQAYAALVKFLVVIADAIMGAEPVPPKGLTRHRSVVACGDASRAPRGPTERP